jgi:hypothetical protein
MPFMTCILIGLNSSITMSVSEDSKYNYIRRLCREALRNKKFILLVKCKGKCKGKGHRITYHDWYRGGSGGMVWCLISTLDDNGWITPLHGHFIPYKITSTHCPEGWMGHMADLDGYGEEKNSCPHYNSNPPSSTAYRKSL